MGEREREYGFGRQTITPGTNRNVSDAWVPKPHRGGYLLGNNTNSQK